MTVPGDLDIAVCATTEPALHTLGELVRASGAGRVVAIDGRDTAALTAARGSAHAYVLHSSGGIAGGLSLLGGGDERTQSIGVNQCLTGWACEERRRDLGSTATARARVTRRVREGWFSQGRPRARRRRGTVRR